MFIDSQGNVCPCDFTMLSFGNILERPIQEIWEETSKHFFTPGPACYANISNEERLPEFYKRMESLLFN